jgi:hypothetical protein
MYIYIYIYVYKYMYIYIGYINGYFDDSTRAPYLLLGVRAADRPPQVPERLLDRRSQAGERRHLRVRMRVRACTCVCMLFARARACVCVRVRVSMRVTVVISAHGRIYPDAIVFESARLVVHLIREKILHLRPVRARVRVSAPACEPASLPPPSRACVRACMIACVRA